MYDNFNQIEYIGIIKENGLVCGNVWLNFRKLL